MGGDVSVRVGQVLAMGGPLVSPAALGFAGSRNRSRYSSSWDDSQPLAGSYKQSWCWTDGTDLNQINGLEWPGLGKEGGH